jgi:hypothetical protein
MGNTAQAPAPTSSFWQLAQGSDLLVTGAVVPDEDLPGVPISIGSRASKGKFSAGKTPASRTPAGASPPVLPASEAGHLAGCLKAERLLLGRLCAM